MMTTMAALLAGLPLMLGAGTGSDAPGSTCRRPANPAERVRQIEVRAFEKVQKAVRHRVAAIERPEALAAY
jgi:hypothetical protein